MRDDANMQARLAPAETRAPAPLAPAGARAPAVTQAVAVARKRAGPRIVRARSVDRELAETSERLRAAIGRLSRRLRPTRAGAGLTPSQISVLFTIVRHGPIGLSELAAIEGVNATMLSRIAGELASARLIVRSASSEDRRQAFVRATAAGKRLRERIHTERTRALGAHVAQLSARERRAIEQALPVLEELAARLGPGARATRGQERA